MIRLRVDVNSVIGGDCNLNLWLFKKVSYVVFLNY